MSRCATCDKPLGRRNTSGFCRNHFANGDPTWRDRRRETIKRKYAADPVALERHRALLRANASTAAATEKRRQAAIACGLWIKGVEAQKADPTFYKRHAKEIADNRLRRLGLPREQWETYRQIMRTKQYRSAEAVQLCLEKHEAEMARFRREIMEARAA